MARAVPDGAPTTGWRGASSTRWRRPGGRRRPTGRPAPPPPWSIGCLPPGRSPPSPTASRRRRCAGGWRWSGGEEALLADEVDYVDDAADGVRVEDAARRLGVEAAWALAWALGLVDALDWSTPVGAEAADILPSPVAPGALPESLLAPALRDDATLADERALAARLLAGLAADPDLEIGVAPGEVDPYVVRERHRALAWLLGGEWTSGG